MNERKLATIRRIKEINPIPKADMIEVATVNGWKVVVKKNDFKVGDLCIYCEIDSFLPIIDEFEFLRKSSYKKLDTGLEGFRLRTIKLRGQISQGIAIDINTGYKIFKDGTPNLDMQWFEGLDVTNMLGIIKYDPPLPACLSGIAKGYMPSFISKTDEERIQNLDEEFEIWKENNIDFYLTEKLDGASVTYYIRNDEFGVCSKNLEYLEDDKNTIWDVARDLDIENKLRTYGLNIALQGEIIGEKIQGNPYNLKGQTVKFFNIFNINTHTYLDLAMFIKTINILELETVPFILKNFKLLNSIDEMLILAEGKSILNPNKEREGLVIRSLDRTISFKIINNKYLL